MSVHNDYLNTVPEKQKPVIEALHKVISDAAPTLQVSIKWGNLTYHNEQNICAIVSHKNHINLQYFKGGSLDDPNKMLEGTGKNMRHIKIRDLSDIEADYISNLIKQSV